MRYKVNFYRTEQGDKPLAAWVRSLMGTQPTLADLVKGGLVKLQDSDQHKPRLVELVDRQARIYEMRVGDANIARVFFFLDDDQVIATNGYVKKRMQLDAGELARARRYKQDWMGRKS